MATRIEVNAGNFAKDIRIKLAPGVIWSEAQKVIAARAREYRDDKIRIGEFPPQYQTYVNGLLGAREESIVQGGVIRYRALQLGDAVALAIAELRRRAQPSFSGTYQSSWRFSISRGSGGIFGGRDYPVSQFDPDKVTAEATEAFVFNSQPYSRKLDVQLVGGRKITVALPAGFFAEAAKTVARRYPMLHAMRVYTVDWSKAEWRQTGPRRRIEYPAVWIGVKPF